MLYLCIVIQKGASGLIVKVNPDLYIRMESIESGRISQTASTS